MISSTVHMLSDQDLREIKRQEWARGFDSANKFRSGHQGNTITLVMDLTLIQIQFLARNYEIATGKPASSIETTKETSDQTTA